jgi:hypothetical protein
VAGEHRARHLISGILSGVVENDPPSVHPTPPVRIPRMLLSRVVAALCVSILGAGTLHAAPELPLILPSPLNSTVPSNLTVVGLGPTGTADPAGSYTVTVRNIYNLPIANSLVILSFPDCGGTAISSRGFEPGVTVDCRPTHRTVRRLTDAQGMARFIIPGGGREGSQALSCLEVSADGTVLGHATVAVLDLDGVSGVAINDLSRWLDAFGNSDPTRTDYDADGAAGINDLAVWLGLFGVGTSVGSFTSPCP